MRTVFRDDHELLRDQVRRWVETAVAPHHAEWEKAHVSPKEVWREAGTLGFLCCAIPENYGGGGGDFGHSAVVIEEMSRQNISGLGFSLHSDIVAPYILRYGSEEQKQRWLPAMARGEMIGAIAMTEPGTGSDLKAVRTSARRDGDDYVINGQKTFITNGRNADLVIVVAKTDPEAGRKGISLIVVETDRAGFSRGRTIEKLGQHAQDTVELFFDDVRVPLSNCLGAENEGFRYLMHELAQERLIIALRSAATLEGILEQTVTYTKDRKAFGQTVFDFQNTRFKLADAKAQLTMLRVFVDQCLAWHLAGELTPQMAAMAKLNGSEVLNRQLDELLQLHGGYGYTTEYDVGRAWADARVLRIYGGSSEIMREIISRAL
jgi:acyl-CoA dehydrogenase